MSKADRAKWDSKYGVVDTPHEPAPSAWLTRQAEALAPGRALELACGLGHNAVWLAQQGWEVDAVDVSHVGLAHARVLAERCGCAVNWILADLDEFAVPAERYDLVLVFRFLERDRLPGLIEAALKPGGVLLYETFTKDQLKRADGSCRNPRFALDAGELPRLFPSLEVTEYCETDLECGATARLIAQKPPGSERPISRNRPSGAVND
jgi:SAM-dependent methyltransferase